MKQQDFINECLLAIGERDYMTSTLTNSPQRRAHAIFKDTFLSFVHECGWSFLHKSYTPVAISGNLITVPQYQQVNSAFYGDTELVPVYADEMSKMTQTQSGNTLLFSLVNSTTIKLYPIPQTLSKVVINYIEEATPVAYSGTALMTPITDNFEPVIRQLMCAKLCLQMLDDQGGYQTFMREYAVRLAKAVQKDQRITRARPNMFRGGR